MDVLIRSRATLEGSELVVVCAASARMLGGPFAGMSDAVGFAVSHTAAANGRILYEAHDERGRTIGERLLLRAAS
jgi:hypothetical protein